MTDRNNSSAESCDLKPCPFCGSPAERLSEGAITCSNSGCPVVCGAPSQGYQLGYDPVASWNTRTGAPAQAVPVAWRWRTSPAHYWALTELYPGDDVTDVQPLYASQPSPAATVELDKLLEGMTPENLHPEIPVSRSSAGSVDALEAQGVIEQLEKQLAYERKKSASNSLQASQPSAATEDAGCGAAVITPWNVEEPSTGPFLREGGYFLTRGNWWNLRQLVGPLELSKDGKWPWKASVYGRELFWRDDGRCKTSKVDDIAGDEVYAWLDRSNSGTNEPQGMTVVPSSVLCPHCGLQGGHSRMCQDGQ